MSCFSINLLFIKVSYAVVGVRHACVSAADRRTDEQTDGPWHQPSQLAVRTCLDFVRRLLLFGCSLLLVEKLATSDSCSNRFLMIYVVFDITSACFSRTCIRTPYTYSVCSRIKNCEVFSITSTSSTINNNASVRNCLSLFTYRLRLKKTTVHRILIIL